MSEGWDQQTANGFKDQTPEDCLLTDETETFQRRLEERTVLLDVISAQASATTVFLLMLSAACWVTGQMYLFSSLQLTMTILSDKHILQSNPIKAGHSGFSEIWSESVGTV